ncbi:HEAT repeat domain-containing protein [Gordonia sp. ABSL49_1]|uniref:HEAT repeat domain-containing protein n=1 Tax=unclassified Gordonia (in: high G+C Gram-positive bacteria) TaxID=2657482 RepID=UPI001F116D01|nr:HEAT repeat domain-containing protein [Gordonia sp. ABSL49_1]MCH5641958.1 HEAT repeat domain-containing protein [Gordonia sp. ABSL49_1]
MLIGEVARRSGVSTRMLRHYDKLGLVRPTGRTSGGYREYSADDITRLLHVESLRTLGMSLRDIHNALDDPGFSPSALVADLIRHTRDRMAADADLLERLEHVSDAGPTDWDSVLHVVALLRGVESEHAALRQRAALESPSPRGLSADSLAEAVLTESDTNVAGALRWALAQSDGDGLSVLAQGLESTDADVRRRAATAIAGFDDDRATELLRRLLTDSDDEIRHRAALALGARGDQVAVTSLVGLIVEGHRDVEAAEILGTYADDPTVAVPIVGTLTTALGDGNPAQRQRLAQALAEIPGPGAVDVLTQMTTDPDGTVAGTAAAILRHRNSS